MTPETLTFHSVDVRAVVLKLRRPVIARIATITEWPLILIDLKTDEGIVGRTYLEPYHCQIDELSRAGLARHGGDAQGPEAGAGRHLRNRAKVAAFRRLRRHGDDRRFRHRHGGMGRPRQSRRHAVVHVARRLARPGARVQQQRALAQVSVRSRRRGRRDPRRRTVRRPETASRPGRSRGRPRHDRCGPPGGRRRHASDDRFQPGSGHGGGLAPVPHARRSRPDLAGRAGCLRQFRRLRPARPGAQDAAADRREFLRTARSAQGACRPGPATM